jgi:hypothetical protein
MSGIILKVYLAASCTASLGRPTDAPKQQSKHQDLGQVVGNEKEGGSGRWQMIGIGLGPRRSRFVFLLNFVVVFDFMYFRFRPSNAKSIGNVLTNRQNAA